MLAFWTRGFPCQSGYWQGKSLVSRVLHGALVYFVHFTLEERYTKLEESGSPSYFGARRGQWYHHTSIQPCCVHVKNLLKQHPYFARQHNLFVVSERIEAYELFPIGITILTVFASKQNIRKLGSSEYSTNRRIHQCEDQGRPYTLRIGEYISSISQYYNIPFRIQNNY